MNFSWLGRFWVVVPVLANLFFSISISSSSVHAFAFNINGGGRHGVQAGAARRRGLDPRLVQEVERSSGIALPRRAQGRAAVEMSAGTGSAWSWSQAAATALAAIQVCLNMYACAGAPHVYALTPRLLPWCPQTEGHGG